MELQKIRTLKNKSMQSVADVIGVSKATMSLIEKGKVKLSTERAKKIANYLNCRVSDIIGETQFDPNDNTIQELVKIPFYPNIVSENYRNDILDIKNSKLLEFRKVLLERLGVENEENYKKVFFTRMVGDTMQPVIKTDDTLLFSKDVKKETINSNTIYLVKEYGRLQVKRIIRETPFSSSIIVKNDNETSQNYQSYSTTIEELPDDFLIGKLIYVGRRFY